MKTRTEATTTPRTFAVILPVGKRPGLRACGDLKPGTPYTVPAREALRLVDAKGFEFVTPADEGAARAAVKAEDEAAAKANESPNAATAATTEA